MEAARLRTRPVCPVCETSMVHLGAGLWQCPLGHAETTITQADEPRASEPPRPTRNWLGMPILESSIWPEPVCLAGPVDRRAGGKSGRQKSPAKQKQEAWLRRRRKERAML